MMRMIKLEVEFLQDDDSDATPSELAHWLSRVLRGEIPVDDLTRIKTPGAKGLSLVGRARCSTVTREPAFERTLDVNSNNAKLDLS